MYLNFSSNMRAYTDTHIDNMYIQYKIFVLAKYGTVRLRKTNASSTAVYPAVRAAERKAVSAGCLCNNRFNQSIAPVKSSHSYYAGELLTRGTARLL